MRSWRRPSMVALTTLLGFREPSCLVRMFLTPAGLQDGAHAAGGDDTGTGRGGLQQHAAGAEATDDLEGDRVASMGTLICAARAASPPLRMASAISLALPMATPTLPLPSPTVTMALKLKRRPPLTTLATRLMLITFSCMSLTNPGIALVTRDPPPGPPGTSPTSSAGTTHGHHQVHQVHQGPRGTASTATIATRHQDHATGSVGPLIVGKFRHLNPAPVLSPPASDAGSILTLDFDSAVPQPAGQGGDASVVEIAAAVEDHRLAIPFSLACSAMARPTL